MARRNLKHLDGSSTLEQFMAQIPSLVSNFMQASLQAEENEKDRLERISEREKEVALREKWRKEDDAREDERFNKSQVVQAQQKKSLILQSMWEYKVGEYNKHLEGWNELTLSVDDAISLNQTDEFAKFAAIAASDPLEQAKLEISQLTSMIKTVDGKINEFKGRKEFQKLFNREITDRGDFYKKGEWDSEETDKGVHLWTSNDFKLLSQDILDDDVFISKVQDKHMENGAWKPYAQEYVDIMVKPTDDRLRQLNEGIFEYETKQFKFKTSKLENELAQIAYQTKKDPDILKASILSEYTSAMDNFDKALVYSVPGFSDMYKKVLVAHDKYTENMGLVEGFLQTTEGVDRMFEDAVRNGYATEDVKDQWDYTLAKQYLQWKAKVDFRKSSGLAFFLGPDIFDSVFSMDKMTYSSFQNALVQAVTNFDTAYIEGDMNQRRKVENGLKRGIGFATKYSGEGDYISLMKDLQNDIGILVGSDDQGNGNELQNNPFIENYFNLQEIEKKIQSIQNTGTEDMEQLLKGDTTSDSQFNIYNELENSLLSHFTGCGQGQTYDAAIGMCTTNSNNEWPLQGLILAQELKRNERNYQSSKNASGLWVEEGSRGSTSTYTGSDRGFPDRRPQQ
tara:strand:+ start:127 stop:1995 length:1869 start_codon:yes stop_codon:yes gene_type:complete